MNHKKEKEKEEEDDDHVQRLSLLSSSPPSVELVTSTNDAPTSPVHIYSGAVANLCSATLGAGILAVPFAFQQAGWVCGMLLLSGAATCTIWSLELLVEASHALQTFTYEGLIQQTFGVTGRRWTEVCILVFCVGTAVAYVVAVGDIIMQSTLNHGHHDRTIAMLIVFGGAMLPLSLLPTMKRLQGASSVGIVSIFILILSAFLHLLTDRRHEKENQNDDEMFASNQARGSMLWPAHGLASVLQACPILLFAFSCQVNLCAIYHEFPSKPHFSRVVWMAVAVCTFLYATISILTMLDVSHTKHTMIPPNVLQLYCPNGWWQIAFASMAIAVVVAFPLNVFPARVTLEGLLFPTSDETGIHNTLQQALLLDMQEDEGVSMDNEGRSEERRHDTDPHAQFRHVGLTVAVAGTAFGLALVVPNISVVFGLLGGTTSSVLGFVLPGCLGIKILGRSSWRSWILLVGGVGVAVVTTAVTIYGTIFLRHHYPDIPDPCHYYNDTLPALVETAGGR